MINEVLDFMARRSIEAMISDDTDEVAIQFTANTNNSSVDLKINQKYPYSMKVKHIGNVLTKQGLDFLMDTPITFTSTVSPILGSAEFQSVWDDGGILSVNINAETDFADKFLKAYSKSNVAIELPVKEIPKVN